MGYAVCDSSVWSFLPIFALFDSICLKYTTLCSTSGARGKGLSCRVTSFLSILRASPGGLKSEIFAKKECAGCAPGKCPPLVVVILCSERSPMQTVVRSGSDQKLLTLCRLQLQS